MLCGPVTAGMRMFKSGKKRFVSIQRKVGGCGMSASKKRAGVPIDRLKRLREAARCLDFATALALNPLNGVVEV